jgi:prepilin-type N-terminal cleavage/methylation domain-containing protein/prepilin-type processing-associated H-X9-DG protein
VIQPIRFARRRGVTLVELLAVIAIIGILIAMLLPAVQAARRAAKRMQCGHNLRQIAIALVHYEGIHHRFPPGEVHGTSALPNYASSWSPPADHCSWDGSIGIWSNLIFPQMELQNEYDMLNFEAQPQFSDPNNVIVMQMKISDFFCPSDPYTGLTSDWGPGGMARIMHYYAVAGSIEDSQLPHPDGTTSYGHCNAHNGMFFNDSRTAAKNIRDGLSHTAMVCETWGRTMVNHLPGDSSRGMNLHNVVYFDWTPNSNHTNPWKANSFHSGGVNVAFADGSVRFIYNTVSLDVFRAMATIRGGESTNTGG